MDYFVDTQTSYDVLADPGFPRECQLLRPTLKFCRKLHENERTWIRHWWMVTFFDAWTCECEIFLNFSCNSTSVTFRYKLRNTTQSIFFVFTQFLANNNNNRLVLHSFRNSCRMNICQIWKSRSNGWMVIGQLSCLRITIWPFD